MEEYSVTRRPKNWVKRVGDLRVIMSEKKRKQNKTKKNLSQQNPIKIPNNK